MGWWVEEWRKKLGLILRDEITYLDLWLKFVKLFSIIIIIIMQLYSAAQRLLLTE